MERSKFFQTSAAFPVYHKIFHMSVKMGVISGYIIREAVYKGTNKGLVRCPLLHDIQKII